MKGIGRRLACLNLAILLAILLTVPTLAVDGSSDGVIPVNDAYFDLRAEELDEFAALPFAAEVPEEVMAASSEDPEDIPEETEDLDELETYAAGDGYMISVGGKSFYSTENQSGTRWEYDAEYNSLYLYNGYQGSGIRTSHIPIIIPPKSHPISIP